jgi:hypothetical protein
MSEAAVPVRVAQLVQQRAKGWMACVRFPAWQDFLSSTVSRPTLGLSQPRIQRELGGDFPRG